MVDQHTDDVYLLAVHTASCQHCCLLAHSWLRDTAAAVMGLGTSSKADSNGSSHEPCSNGWHADERPNGCHAEQKPVMQPSCEACEEMSASPQPVAQDQQQCMKAQAVGQQGKVGHADKVRATAKSSCLQLIGSAVCLSADRAVTSVSPEHNNYV